MEKLRYPLITATTTLLQQAKKVKAEAQELIDAIESGEPPARIIGELCDVEQAAETATVRGYQRFGALNVSRGRIEVVKKNALRGYYAPTVETLDISPPEVKERCRTFVMPKGDEG